MLETIWSVASSAEGASETFCLSSTVMPLSSDICTSPMSGIGSDPICSFQIPFRLWLLTAAVRTAMSPAAFDRLY